MIDPKTAKEKYYHAYLDPACPMDYVTVGGVCFQKATFRPEVVDEQGKESKPRRHRIGMVVHLNEAQLRAVLAGIENRVVRKRGTSYKIVLRSGHRMQYREYPDDTPLAQWIGLKVVADDLSDVPSFRDDDAPRAAIDVGIDVGSRKKERAAG